ncbi:Uncharacterised protein [Rikenella microfusus]|uniref:Uncharacterized protein n=1 Tax=Rikenella microfusus TaxID=28139 RepID=A0A379MPF6_9BACT|nr:Uncharacterised protein [Rikenella microfusus]
MADDGRHNSRRLPRQRFSTAMRRRSPLFGYRMARGAACGGRTNRSRDWCCGPPLREAAARPLAREPGYSLTTSLRTACWRGTRNRSLIRAPGKPWQYELPFVCRFSSFGGVRGAFGNAGFSHSGQPGPVTEARNRVVTASRSPLARGPVRERNILRFRQRGGTQGLKKKIFQTNPVCLKQIFSGAPPDVFAVRLPNSSRFPHL